jgi:hypothetical protein
MLFEWKLHGTTRNLGDALGELLSPQDYADDEEKMYFVIGSVICDTVIKETLGLGYKPVFIDCGWRGEELARELVQESTFIGCRGPMTQGELARHGVHVEVTGDSAYRVPGIVPKAKSNHRRIAIPHIEDPKRLTYTAARLGVDEIVQPDVLDKLDLVDKIKIISGADFVFAGAMHAGILAHAYGVPFGLMLNGYVNIPAKWSDWLQSIGVKSNAFYQTAHEAERWWVRNVKQLPSRI